jgi:hypothetical protein
MTYFIIVTVMLPSAIIAVASLSSAIHSTLWPT